MCQNNAHLLNSTVCGLCGKPLPVFNTKGGRLDPWEAVMEADCLPGYCIPNGAGGVQYVENVICNDCYDSRIYRDDEHGGELVLGPAIRIGRNRTTVKCGICGSSMTSDMESIIDAGWFPDYWIDENTPGNGACCPACSEHRINWDTDEPTLKPRSDWTA